MAIAEEIKDPTPEPADAMQSLMDKIDRMGRVREARISGERRVKKLKAVEDELREEIRCAMLERNMTVVGGRLWRVSSRPDTNYSVVSWEDLYEYIYEHKAWELLHKRLGVGAAQEHIDDIGTLPGVEVSETTKLMVTRVRSK